MGRSQTQLSVGQTIVLNTFLKEMPAPSYSFNTVLARMAQLDENFELQERFVHCNPAKVAEEMKIMAVTFDTVLNNYRQITQHLRKLGARLECGQPVMDDWYQIKPLLDRVQHYEVEDAD